MKTSQQWWDEVKQSPSLLNEWLVKQYRGEVTAANRIRDLADKFKIKGRTRDLLEVIATQEETHASWVLALLKARGIQPSVENAENRYWAEVLPGIDDFATGTAVAAHAEKMRLDRIQVISNDTEAPADIRNAFERILKDELFHEKAFRSMSTSLALEATKDNHERGMQVLGLVA